MPAFKRFHSRLAKEYLGSSHATNLTFDLRERVEKKTWQIPFWSPARRAASVQ